MQTWKLWSLGAFLAIVAGCGGGISFEEPLCREDAPCGAGYVCKGGTCKPGCSESSPCGGGFLCEGGACRPGCNERSPCGSGFLCEGGTCKPGCRVDGDCGDDSYVCKGATEDTLGACKPGCIDDKDCHDEKYVCKANVCQLKPVSVESCEIYPGGTHDSCFSKYGPGYLCDENEKVCKLRCHRQPTDTCDIGYVCDETGNGPLGICRPGCRTSAPQPCVEQPGYVCVSSENTADPSLGTCKPGCRRKYPSIPNNLESDHCLGDEKCVTDGKDPSSIGSCHAVDCVVGGTPCPNQESKARTCVGIRDQIATYAGVCRFLCRTGGSGGGGGGTAYTCPAGWTCSLTGGTPGICVKD